MDSTVLTHAAVGHLACKVVSRLLRYARDFIDFPMDMSMKQLYAGHIFHSTARLDLPTMEDPAVQKQLYSTMSTWRYSVAFETIEVLTSIVTTFISVLSQLLVLFTVLHEQQDGLLLIILGCSRFLVLWYTKPGTSSSSGRSMYSRCSEHLSESGMQFGLRPLMIKITYGCKAWSDSSMTIFTARNLSQATSANISLHVC
jgi:hypothetical protein